MSRHSRTHCSGPILSTFVLALVLTVLTLLALPLHHCCEPSAGFTTSTFTRFLGSSTTRACLAAKAATPSRPSAVRPLAQSTISRAASRTPLPGFKTVTWAAMDFLLRAMKKNRRRLKFEQWLLLATRCAILLLLVLPFAGALVALASVTTNFVNIYLSSLAWRTLLLPMIKERVMAAVGAGPVAEDR